MLFDKTKLSAYPKECGVYLMKDSTEKILYIGKANNIKARLKQYFEKTDTRASVSFLLRKIASIETIVTSSEKDALLLENTLIKKHQPPYNVLLKDDKTFVSLMINHKNPWPMLKLVRHKGASKKDGLYFGPYTNTLAAKETMDLLAKLFPLRQCSDQELASRKRPCLLYSIKRCCAPCVGKCSKEEYSSLVDHTIQFLKGQDETILKDLVNKRDQASENLEFEKASRLQKTLEQLQTVIKQGKSLVQSSIGNCDVIGLYRQGYHILIAILNFQEGLLIGSDHFDFQKIGEEDNELMTSFLLQYYLEKKERPEEIFLGITPSDQSLLLELLKPIKIIFPEKGDKKHLVELAEKNAKLLFHQEQHDATFKENLLQEMQETLQLTTYPMKIECIDTSNLSGTTPVASVVTFINGEKHPALYRTYHIKLGAGDDYHAMQETLVRRYTKAKDANALPDLIIVDGGKGQLNIALKVLKELDIVSCNVIGLAKEDSRHDKGLTQELIFTSLQKEPIILSRHSPVLFLLQQIRDEAHRKAITLHRKKRANILLTSEIDNLQGIGPVKKKQILKHFGSIKKLKEASYEELTEVKGLTQANLSTLWAFIQNKKT
jgi:excinuclease ABC subunit C